MKIPPSDLFAPRPEALRYKQLRATLEAAHNRLHQRMHKHGVFHEHTPLHDHGHSHEHSSPLTIRPSHNRGIQNVRTHQRGWITRSRTDPRAKIHLRHPWLALYPRCARQERNLAFSGQFGHGLAMNLHETAVSGRPQRARVSTGPKAISYLKSE